MISALSPPRISLTVGGSLLQAAGRYGDREAMIFDDRRATFAALLGEARHLAKSLLGAGIRLGDHVGILMPNCWESVLLFYACNLIGAPAVLINARYRDDDLAYVIPKADLSFLLIGGQQHRFNDYRATLTSIFPELGEWDGASTLSLGGAPKLRSIIEVGDDRPGRWPDMALLDAGAARISNEQLATAMDLVTPDHVSMMMFSSGTTSRPKACMLNHRSLCETGAALAERFRLEPEDRMYDPLPLFHMSTMLPLAACRAAGSCFIGTSHFEASGALDRFAQDRVTIVYAGFPAIVSSLIAHPLFADWDQSSLRIMHVVGPPDLLKRYQRQFPGAVLVNSYGLTEATGVPCYSDLDDPPDLLCETNGRLFDGMRAKIVDHETEREVAKGEPGEIRLKGFCLFVGYYDDPEATAAAVGVDGWLRTGDLGRIGPGGRIVYEGRLKDMLKIGGENVAAVELESFLMTHPAVRMAQVIGVPDERLMEVAAAYIELHDGETLYAVDVVRYCAGRIANYKIPRYVRFVEEWPMSATKVQKFQLRQTFEPIEKFDVQAMTRAQV